MSGSENLSRLTEEYWNYHTFFDSCPNDVRLKPKTDSIEFATEVLKRYQTTGMSKPLANFGRGNYLMGSTLNLGTVVGVNVEYLQTSLLPNLPPVVNYGEKSFWMVISPTFERKDPTGRIIVGFLAKRKEDEFGISEPDFSVSATLPYVDFGLDDVWHSTVLTERSLLRPRRIDVYDCIDLTQGKRIKAFDWRGLLRPKIPRLALTPQPLI